MRLTALACILLCALLAVSCASASTPAQPAGQPVALDPGAAPQLPAPAQLARGASAATAYRLASQFMANTANRVSPASGFGAAFTPDYAPKSASDGLAYAVYELSATGQPDGVQLQTVWRASSTPSGVWLGLADFTRNVWQWRTLDSPGGAALALDRQADANGRVLAVVALTGTTPRTLQSLYLGDPPPSPHAQITAGCTLVGGGNYGSRSTAASPLFEPLLWTSEVATGGDKLSLQGTLPAAGWAGYHGAGRVLFWTMHEAMWSSGKDGFDDNDRFRSQAFEWLLAGRTRVGVSRAHGGGMGVAGLSASLKAWMDGAGVGYADEPAEISANVLANYDLLFICYPDPWPAEQVAALAQWVEDGGSVLMCSQGWSWSGNGPHPLNVLGEPFGLWISSGIVSDPDAPNGAASTPNFAVAPLSEYDPAEVIVLKKGVDDLDSVKVRAAQQPNDIFVLEGDHFGLQVPTVDWPRLNDPSAAVDVLDQMYMAQLAYTGGNPPYGGEIVWAISKYDPAGAYWMHSGNPIVMKQEAGSDVVDTLNASGLPGWGLPHELGHDMHQSACGDNFIPYDLVEPAANVFTVWTYNYHGWDLNVGNHADYAAAGVAYHNQANPDIAQLKADAWIMLGCWDLIWQEHGFGGMQAFLTEVATEHAAGTNVSGDANRIAYLVEGMSRAYELDFSPLYEHWGFPLSVATKTYTDQWPDSSIPF